jgi:hypothetical protein
MQTMSKTELSETEARDRVELLVSYLRALIASATDSFETAADVKDESEAKRNSCNAFTCLAIAGEYLDELARLEERPVSLVRAVA